MKRRRFQKMLFFAGITAPPLIGVRAQPKPKLRIGCASPGGSRDDRATGFTALFERLSELGYVEGRNLEVDFVLAPNTNFLAAYNAFVRRGADLLLVIGQRHTPACRPRRSRWSRADCHARHRLRPS